VPFSSSHQAPSDACKVPGETVAYSFKEIKKETKVDEESNHFR
jgi:hypothetical protein